MQSKDMTTDDLHARLDALTAEFQVKLERQRRILEMFTAVKINEVVSKTVTHLLEAKLSNLDNRIGDVVDAKLSFVSAPFSRDLAVEQGPDVETPKKHLEAVCSTPRPPFVPMHAPNVAEEPVSAPPSVAVEAAEPAAAQAPPSVAAEAAEPAASEDVEPISSLNKKTVMGRTTRKLGGR
jgi:hypothetical protein